MRAVIGLFGITVVVATTVGCEPLQADKMEKIVKLLDRIEEIRAYLDRTDPGITIGQIEKDLDLPEPAETRFPATLDPVWRIRYEVGEYHVYLVAQTSRKSSNSDNIKIEYRAQIYMESEVSVPHLDYLSFVNSIGMGFVHIPPGVFLMGTRHPASSTMPVDDGLHSRQRLVLLTKGFSMCTRETTVEQFQKFVLATGYVSKHGFLSERERDFLPRLFDEPPYWENPGFPQAPKHPVVAVTWNDAVAFCKWLTQKEGRHYRLPTEAEWEYACRAGTSTAYHSGDSETELLRVAGKKWADYATEEVQRYAPNAFGLYDMHGNAAEWCSDWYAPYPTGEEHDPKGPPTGNLRVVRSNDMHATRSGLRSDARSALTPWHTKANYGFRVVVDLGSATNLEEK